MARNGPRRWSVSAAQVLEQCLFQFRLKYVDRIDAPPRDIPIHWRRGTVVHAGLEAAFKHRKADRNAVLKHHKDQKLFYERRLKEDLSPTQRASAKDLHAQIIQKLKN